MSTRYKIVETTGCTAFNFTVNDHQLSDMTDHEYNEMLDYFFVKIKEGLKENTILLLDVVELFQPDNWKYDPEPCDQCGDTVSDTTWNI
jgi:hypothetical protein